MMEGWSNVDWSMTEQEKMEKENGRGMGANRRRERGNSLRRLYRGK